MKIYRKVECATSDIGYVYILTHGIGPGTLPKRVNIIKSQDIGQYTVVWLDDFLTTSELEYYDVPSETELKDRLERLGYKLVDNELVDVESSDRYFANMSNVCATSDDSKLYTIKSISDDGIYYLVKNWRKNNELWVSYDSMNAHSNFWFTSQSKAIQSLKTLLGIMDDYLSDKFYLVDNNGNQIREVKVSELGF